MLVLPPRSFEAPRVLTAALLSSGAPAPPAPQDGFAPGGGKLPAPGSPGAPGALRSGRTAAPAPSAAALQAPASLPPAPAASPEARAFTAPSAPAGLLPSAPVALLPAPSAPVALLQEPVLPGADSLRPAAHPLQAPPTAVNTVWDDYHGKLVPDPYRWLENSADPAVQAWTQAQNEYTKSILEAAPGREVIASRLEQLLTTGGIGTPGVHGDRTFYSKRDGRQNQPVLYVQDAQGERVALDPNQWSQDGTEALDWNYASKDGRYLAYGRSSGGDEWSTLHVLDLETGQELPEQIARTRAASLAWLPDGSGFYYTKYPEAGSVPPGEENYHRHVYFHKLGEDPARDPKIFGEGLEKEFWPNLSLSQDGRHLLISVSRGWTATDVHVLDRETGEMKTLVSGEDATYEGQVEDGKVYLKTDSGAPHYKLVKVDLAHPERENWQELLPEQAGTLQNFDLVKGKLVVDYLENASSHLYVLDTEGRGKQEIPLPTLGSLSGFSTDPRTGDIYYNFSSFNVPPTIVKHNVETGQSSTWARVDIPGFNPEDYQVSQQWYTSKDGTRVPMFLVHKKGLDLNGDNPTLLYGYGGFNVSMTPTFSRSNLLWLENGGVYALANLRGGGEFGKQWHEGGMLDKKQHVFDDMISAAEWLIEKDYTSPERLGCYGGSNGGLLIGAVVTQRPDLFGAAVSAVPLLDMDRYDQFGIARLWIPEYGSAGNPDQFPFIHAYSPYQNVKDNTQYPPTLFMSGAGDSRVDPLHARKMVARMQDATSSGEPVLLREEARAGHGAGKPIAKVIEAETDRLSFLFSELGVTPQKPAA